MTLFTTMDYSSTTKFKSHKKKCAVIYCFIPTCPSNSVKFPEKLFLTVPQEPKLREKWIKIAGRQHLPSPKSVLRCCEDHFDMEKDVENWIKYKLVGGNLMLKKGVVPHILDCQQRKQTSKDRPIVLKLERPEIHKSIKNEQESVADHDREVEDDYDDVSDQVNVDESHDCDGEEILGI